MDQMERHIREDAKVLDQRVLNHAKEFGYPAYYRTWWNFSVPMHNMSLRVQPMWEREVIAGPQRDGALEYLRSTVAPHFPDMPMGLFTYSTFTVDENTEVHVTWDGSGSVWNVMMFERIN